MKTAIYGLACLSLVLFSFQAKAQTPINQQQTQVYYQSCLKQPSQTMEAATKDTFCQCTALHMQKNMTLEDLIAQSGNDQAARNALNKTLTQVYAPCLQYPIRDLVAKRCAQERKITDPKVCGCAADKMAEFTAREAQTSLPGILAANPNITDPTAAFMESAAFKSSEEQIADYCGRLAQPQ